MGSSKSRYCHLDDAETLRKFVGNLREGIYITTPDGEILDCNPAFLEVLGLGSIEELAQLSAADLFVDPEERKRERGLLGDAGAIREFEFQIRRPDGVVRTLLDSCYRLEDEETGEVFYHGILIDITERKELERRLREQSIRDPLTGCFNRRRLREVAVGLAEADRTWGAIVVDVDHFKSYNDTYGHAAGDEVLVALSRFIMRRVRPEDPVFRIGGDEFLVIVIDDSEGSTSRLATRIREAAIQEASLPFSLGWAVREGEETVEATVKRADHALFEVRSRERGPESERRRGRSVELR